MSTGDSGCSITYSVVVPVYNEETTIKCCLDSLLATDLAFPQLEVLVVDGLSEDKTREIVRGYSDEYESVRLLDNPDRTTPTGMNVGAAASQNDAIVLLSGHSHVDPDFFEQMTATFTEHAPGADVVGGQMVPQGDRCIEHAIAIALTTPIGSSSTRFEPVEGYVETVNFGAYRRYVWEDVGKVDPSLPRGQDYEYNRRVREHGYRIYQNPLIKIYYTPRSSFVELARQYYGNGLWKTRVYRQYDDYPVAPKFLTLFGVITILGFVVGIITNPVLVGFVGVSTLLYLLLVVLISVRALWRSDDDVRLLPFIVVALVVMHVTFGLGLVRGTVRAPL